MVLAEDMGHFAYGAAYGVIRTVLGYPALHISRTERDLDKSINKGENNLPSKLILPSGI